MGAWVSFPTCTAPRQCGHAPRAPPDPVCRLSAAGCTWRSGLAQGTASALLTPLTGSGLPCPLASGPAFLGREAPLSQQLLSSLSLEAAPRPGPPCSGPGTSCPFWALATGSLAGMCERPASTWTCFQVVLLGA